ncbi:MAG: hypothetical protein JO303_13875 [Caulobacteraceae bacterium]|nr:hypothetical protein [Caulobacteraceae bacterium]
MQAGAELVMPAPLVRRLFLIAVLASLVAAGAPQSGWCDTAPDTSPPSALSSDPAIYGDDETNPIPYLDRLDILAKGRRGDVTLVMVIATPLAADDQSMRRLMRKLDNYTLYARSEAYRAKFGEPSPATTTIKVVIDARSDPGVFAWLETAKPLAIANGVRLVVEKRPAP